MKISLTSSGFQDPITSRSTLVHSARQLAEKLKVVIDVNAFVPAHAVYISSALLRFHRSETDSDLETILRCTLLHCM